MKRCFRTLILSNRRGGSQTTSKTTICTGWYYPRAFEVASGFSRSYFDQIVCFQADYRSVALAELEIFVANFIRRFKMDAVIDDFILTEHLVRDSPTSMRMYLENSWRHSGATLGYWTKSDWGHESLIAWELGVITERKLQGYVALSRRILLFIKGKPGHLPRRCANHALRHDDEPYDENASEIGSIIYSGFLIQ